jgi:molybdopterin-synthase adenylyltransferase
VEEFFDLDEEARKLSDDRYERQKRISWWNQKILEKAHILVVGAGTLGNEVCKNLALLGVGTVTIIDNDTVEEVNLSRSILMRQQDKGKNKANVIAAHMYEINSDMIINPIDCDIIYEFGSGNYRDFDLVLMTVDNLEARLWINKYCYMWGKPLIDGGLNALTCTIQVIEPPSSPCYECSFTGDHYRSIRKKYSCDGLKRNAPEGKIAMVITSAAICAGLMTQEAVKILHKLPSGLSGKRMIIDGETNEFDIVDLNLRESCLGHQTKLDDVLFLPYTSLTHLSDLKSMVMDRLKCDDVEIEHDKSILYKMVCPECGMEKDYLEIAARVKEDEVICSQCGSSLRPEVSGILKRDGATLADHGVPENHVLRVYLGDGNLKYLAQEPMRHATL